jgi:hypothetical protein
VSDRLLTHVVLGESAELLIDDGEQRIEGRRLAVAPFVRRVGHTVRMFGASIRTGAPASARFGPPF